MKYSLPITLLSPWYPSAVPITRKLELCSGESTKVNLCYISGSGRYGRMRDRFLLHGGIHHDPLEIFGLDRPAPVGHREALLQQRGDLLLTQPLAPAGQ